MSISKLDRLQKRIDTLLEWQSCLVYLAEEHLTPFDKWCIRNEVSNEDQLFIANLCMMFSLHLYPEKEHPDKERILNNFKKMFGAKDIEISLKTFNNYLEEYQNNQNHFLRWDARELLDSLLGS
ncbi:hypothetical protein [Paenibacillus alvei]|uniref:Uncharacterized protein n=1 Tax=Paenibacillus alvei TaxID=44250 RepID=A0AAP7DJB9_PAEAL|nr:hypothetical protein [Paenibacillus alvei]NEZ40351.1 hypothetical protein [Paenibacillus alvei]NOJ71526.1 hypothetical protein [Paenibacillus alvei]